MSKRGPSGPKGDAAERILEAADSLVSEAGYDQTSVRQVAERAGVNKALVFYYFNSKAELFNRVLERYYKRHLEVLTAAAAREGTLHERLHMIVDAYFGFIVENQRYPRLVQQIVAGDEEHLDMIRRNLAVLHDYVVELLSDLAPKTGPLAARQFFVTISSSVINYFTFAPALKQVWDGDPLAPHELEERREHLHWLIDAITVRLRNEPAAEHIVQHTPEQDSGPIIAPN